MWDRDDKQPKRVAREMMRMVLDVNTRPFGGRMVVTCYTCHRGAVAPDRFPPLPPRDYSTISETRAPTLPAVDDVWNAYVRAVAEPVRGFSTTVLTATDDRSEGRHGTLEVVFKGADRVRLTSRMPPDAPASQTVNGESGWIASGSGSRALRPDEISRARRTALRHRPIKIDRPANSRIVGVEQVGSRDAYVAVTEVDARTKTLWFFDVVTGLLLRERTTTETALVPLQEQIDDNDYRRVDGVMLPFVMRSSDGAPFDTSIRVFTSIRHNVDVDDSTFEMPARPPQNAGERFRSVRALTDMPALDRCPRHDRQRHRRRRHRHQLAWRSSSVLQRVERPARRRSDAIETPLDAVPELYDFQRLQACRRRDGADEDRVPNPSGGPQWDREESRRVSAAPFWSSGSAKMSKKIRVSP